MSLPSKSVLVTGASSGIGAATARRLAARGFRVYATARDRTAIAGLASEGCEILQLDVTDESSMQAAVAAMMSREGAIGALVNNAGYSQSGALETLPIDAVRRQFETNVFGLLRLTQIVLPYMRQQKSGRIMNLSSMGGRLTFPGGGAYHASKYAVEALSDVLRFEVKGFGIDVIIVEPGLIRSGFANAAVQSIEAADRDSPYAGFNSAVANATRQAYEKGPLAALSGTPETVAKVIERALKARRPKTRYVVTGSGHLLLTQRAVMTDRMWDGFLALNFPRPGLTP